MRSPHICAVSRRAAHLICLSACHRSGVESASAAFIRDRWLAGPEPNRSHVDIWVRDVDAAIGQILAIGGRVRRQPTIYPRPRSYEGEPPRIDWAVMQDPFGNEFCLVSVLTPEEAATVIEAASATDGDDHHWRVAAGRATR